MKQQIGTKYNKIFKIILLLLTRAVATVEFRGSILPLNKEENIKRSST